MSGLSGLERTLNSLSSGYGDLNEASELFDSSVIDNWRDSSNKKIQDAMASNQEKDSQGEAYLGLGVGEYPTYKLIKGIAKKGYDMYKKRGTTEEDTDATGDGETPGNDSGEIQMDSMPDESGFEGLDDAPTTFASTTATVDPDASLETPEELSSAPLEPDVPENPVFQADDVDLSPELAKSLPPKTDDASFDVGAGESDDFDLFPSGLGDTAQVQSLSTVSSTQGGSYSGLGEVSSSQQLSGLTEQQGAIDLNRARSAGQDLPSTAEEGLSEGQELDQLAPLREAFGLNQPKAPAPEPESEASTSETATTQSSQAGAEGAGASGESSGASGITDMTTNLTSGAEDAVSNTVGGLSEGLTDSLASGASDALVSGASEGMLGFLGGAAGEAGAAVLGAIPGVAEVAAVGAAVYGVVEGLEDLFGGHKSTKPPPPPKPQTFNFKGSSLGQQNQIALPSVDGVVDTPASLTAF